MKKLNKNPSGKLLVLDLDQTLVFVDNSHAWSFKTPADFEFNLGDDKYKGYKRPYLKEFLIEIFKNDNYDLAVWSKGSFDYVNKIIRLSFPGYIPLKFIWSKENCIGDFKNVESIILKFGYSKENIYILDDVANYWINYKLGNLILISPFKSNKNDQELMKIYDALN